MDWLGNMRRQKEQKLDFDNYYQGKSVRKEIDADKIPKNDTKVEIHSGSREYKDVSVKSGVSSYGTLRKQWKNDETQEGYPNY